MVPLYRCAPLLAVPLLLFLAACQDASGPDGPVGLDLAPSMSHVTTDNPLLGADENNGLFFFRPPIDTDETPQGFLDTAVEGVLFVELCNVEGLVWDEFSSVCPTGRLVERLDHQSITIASAGSFDFFATDFGLNQETVEEGSLHSIRVMFGSPGTAGTFFVYGALPIIFTENSSEQDFDVSPVIARTGNLPVKFFVSDLATSQLACDNAQLACTYAVWDLTAQTQTLCLPDSNCGPDATAGLRGNQATLQEIAGIIGANEIFVSCQQIDPNLNPNPLGTDLIQSPEFIDCSFLPGFLLSQNLLDLQVCNRAGQDFDAFTLGHRNGDGLVEFLAEQSNSAIFSESNCSGLGQLAADAGLFDKIRFAANSVFRPLAGFLGPQPLSAFNVDTWGSRDGATPYALLQKVDLLANRVPEAFVQAGTTVTAAVCVALAHLDPTAPPGDQNQLQVTFEVTEGPGTVSGGQSAKVLTTLRPKTADDDCDVTNESGEIAVASVQWDGLGLGPNELKALIPGEYVQLGSGANGVTVEPVDISFTFSTEGVELLAACTVPDEFAAYDQFAQRGFYILPSEFGIEGDVLRMVQLRISSNDKSSGGLAGEYRVSLSARAGGYHPDNTVGTAEATFTLSGNPPENQIVTFTFSGLPTLSSEPLGFVAEILDAPRNNARLWFRVPEKDKSDFPRPGDLSCPGAIVTNGTTFTTPLDTDRRQGMDITLLGVNNVNN